MIAGQESVVMQWDINYVGGTYPFEWSSPLMMLLILCGLVVGVALGQRFTVLVLVPAVFLFVALLIDTSAVRADFWPIVFIAAATAVSLQVGYLLGIGIATLVGDFRANRLYASGQRRSTTTRLIIDRGV